MGEQYIIILLLFGLSSASLPNGCPSDFTIHRLLRHETDCDKYYTCSNGQRILMTCPDNTLFDYHLQVCNHADAVVCEFQTTESSDATTESADATAEYTDAITESADTTTEYDDTATANDDFLPNGCPANFSIHLLLSHETDCDKFYSCSNGQNVLFICPSGTLFNFELQSCDWADVVSCTSKEFTTVQPATDDTSQDPVTPSEPIEVTTSPNEYVGVTTSASHPTEASSFSTASSTTEFTVELFPTEATTVASAPSVCPDGFFGSVPHPEMCDSYFVCTGWDPIQLFCLPGHEFDSQLQVCIEIIEGGCTWHQQQRTTTESGITSETTITDATQDTNTTDFEPVTTPDIAATTFEPTTEGQVTTTKESNPEGTTTETEDVTTESTPTSPSVCPDGFFGSVPHPELCESYFVCTGWDPIQLFCLPGFEFDPLLQSCVAISEGGCTWHQNKTTTEASTETTREPGTSDVTVEQSTVYTITETTQKETTGTDTAEPITEYTTPSLNTEGTMVPTTKEWITSEFTTEPISVETTINTNDTEVTSGVFTTEKITTAFVTQEDTTTDFSATETTIVQTTADDWVVTISTDQETVTTDDLTTAIFTTNDCTEATIEFTEANTEFTTTVRPICPDGYFGNVPHPERCDAYYLCSGWNPILLYCSPGSEFDPETGQCVAIAEGGCTWNQTSTTSFTSSHLSTPQTINPELTTTEMTTESGVTDSQGVTEGDTTIFTSTEKLPTSESSTYTPRPDTVETDTTLELSTETLTTESVSQGTEPVTTEVIDYTTNFTTHIPIISESTTVEITTDESSSMTEESTIVTEYTTDEPTNEVTFETTITQSFTTEMDKFTTEGYITEYSNSPSTSTSEIGELESTTHEDTTTITPDDSTSQTAETIKETTTQISTKETEVPNTADPVTITTVPEITTIISSTESWVVTTDTETTDDLTSTTVSEGLVTEQGTTSEATGSVTPGICPDGYFGNIAHPEHCDAYYLCSGWNPILLFCPLGYEFDPYSAACIEISEGGCTWSKTSTTPEIEQTVGTTTDFIDVNTTELITEESTLDSTTKVIDEFTTEPISDGITADWTETTENLSDTTLPETTTTVVETSTELVSSTLTTENSDITTSIDETATADWTETTENLSQTTLSETSTLITETSTEFVSSEPTTENLDIATSTDETATADWTATTENLSQTTLTESTTIIAETSTASTVTDALITESTASTTVTDESTIENIESSTTEQESIMTEETTVIATTANPTTQDLTTEAQQSTISEENTSTADETPATSPESTPIEQITTELILTTEEIEVNTPAICPVGYFGNIPHPERCDAYYLCSGWNPILLFCPSGQEFDPEAAACVVISEGGCTWLQTSTTATSEQTHTESSTSSETMSTTESFTLSTTDLTTLTTQKDTTLPELTTVSEPTEIITTTESTTNLTTPTELESTTETESVITTPAETELTTTTESEVTIEPELTTTTTEIEGTSEAIEVTTPSVCPDGYFGMIANVEECDAYYLCTGFVPIPLRCPSGHEFSYDAQACVEIAEGGCSWPSTSTLQSSTESAPSNTDSIATETTTEAITIEQTKITTTITESTTLADTESTIITDTEATTSITVDENGFAPPNPGIPDIQETTPDSPTEETTTVLIETTEVAELICPDGFFGMVANVEECDAYYLCSGWIPIPLRCPSGYEFSSDDQACVVISEGGCTLNRNSILTNLKVETKFKGRMKNTVINVDRDASKESNIIEREGNTGRAVNIKGVCEPGFFGNIGKMGSCNTFYMCKDGMALEMNCLLGTQFDDSMQKCVPDSRLGCEVKS